MDRLEEILAANKAFVAHGKHDYIEEDIAASKLPKKKMAIFTCMDTRLTEILEPAMGIQRGDAKIIRTVGNYLNESSAVNAAEQYTITVATAAPLVATEIVHEDLKSARTNP